MRKICVHVVNIGNYFPELTQLTLPTIEAFCDRIKADLNIITKRKFPSQYILTEKLQVYEDGKDYAYNILLDMDILVHPKCYNPFLKNIPKGYVAFKDNYFASNQLGVDNIFEEDGRNVGISGCAVFTCRKTHNLWKPIDDLTIQEIDNNILQNRKIVDEYTLSRNLAKYKFKYIEPYPIYHYNLMYHLGSYNQNENEILNRAKIWHKYYWK